MAVNAGFSLLMQVIYIAIFAVCLFAVIEAVRTPAQAFPAMDKQTKTIWLAILGVSALFSLMAALTGSGMLTFLALVAALIFILDVRPAVRGVGRNDGPYGPW